MTPNQVRWLAVYSEELCKAITERPEEYAWPIENVLAVATKMTLGLARGGANKDGIAIRRTCRALGVPYTYGAIKAFLTQ